MDYTKASKLTAISRKLPSVPMRWLRKQEKLQGNMLDYGCGKGKDADYYMMERYDPNWRTTEENIDVLLPNHYDVITCNYVLNTLPQSEMPAILNTVQRLLKNDGIAYFTVRRDIKTDGLTRRGTYQSNVKLPLQSIRKTSTYEIYAMPKDRTGVYV